jgi:hypothetical protein|tara:strand:+ start:268 stop:540 length:273 start_codon:yes stop_codon:yes gene_type:complete
MSLSALYRFATINGGEVRQAHRFVLDVVQLRLKYVPIYGQPIVFAGGCRIGDSVLEKIDEIAEFVLKAAQGQEAGRERVDPHRNKLADLK